MQQHIVNGPPDAYRLGRRLRSGRTGDVYEATHPRLPGRYALKILRADLVPDAEVLAGFRAEVEALAALRHPNIVEVIEIGAMPDGTPFLVMELLEGQTLAERLIGAPGLPLPVVAELTRGIAAGLHAAHMRGIFHRALAADSVFLAAVAGHEHGFPKIMGFGTSRLVGDDEELSAEMARAIAPEQAQGMADAIDGRADEFALGVIVHRMLGGQEPFPGRDPIEVLRAVVNDEPAPLPDVPAGVAAVVKRALAKRAADRFPSVLGFARAFEEALLVPERTAPAPLVSPPPASAPAAAAWGEVEASEFDDLDDAGPLRVPRQRSLVAALVLGAVTVVVGGALLLGWRPPASWREARIWDQLPWRPARQPQVVPSPPPVIPDEAAPIQSEATALAAEAPMSTLEAGTSSVAPETRVEGPVASESAVRDEAPPVRHVESASRGDALPVRQGRAKARDRGPLRGWVWSEQEQRLVPSGAVGEAALDRPVPPAGAQPVAPPPRPAAAPGPISVPAPLIQAPAPTAPAAERPVSPQP